MSAAAYAARRWWALWVLLLAGTPVRAQDADAAQRPEASPAPGVDAAEQQPPPAPAPTEPPSRAAPATHPVVDPTVPAPTAAPVSPAGVAPGLAATVASPASSEHRHLGLFFHADIGGGYFRVSGSRGASSFTIESGALGVGLAVGWAPDDEWAIGLELWSWKSLKDSSLGADTTVGLLALGLNLTHYLVPADVFASVVVSGTRLAITDPGERVEYGASDIGFGFKVLLGKEWHVSSWLGLGLGGELFLSVNRDGGQTLRTLGGGLVFSVTGR